LQTHEPIDYERAVTLPGGLRRVLHIQGQVVVDESGNPTRMVGTVQDVTERKLVEEQLINSNEKLRALATRTQSVREEESIRIAREIHDELGSALTGLKMDMAFLDKRRSQLGAGEWHKELSALSELIDGIIKKVRNIATELRPSVLDDLGLAAAIEWQAQEFQRRTQIECRIVSLPETLTLSRDKSTALFRILQEILTNVGRHAHATVVEICLEQRGPALTLEVSDNGRGIKEGEIANTKSLGLLGIRERALVFGGDVSFTGTGGKGTVVTVRIPID
jgi:signal transduction histidine kinase